MSADPKTYGPLHATRCPQCDYTLTGATIAHGEDLAPQEGDTSICANCGQLLTYKADLTLRGITTEEIRALMDDPLAWSTIEKAQKFILDRGRFA
jgi:hypothetical protein